MSGPVVRVDPTVLRAALGAEVVLRAGTVIGGRLAELRGSVGLLVLRGAPVVAELPPGLQAGQALRLLVEGRTSDGKIALRLLPAETEQAQGATTQGPPPVVPWVPLPGGARLRAEREAPEDEARSAAATSGEARAVAVRFEGPGLGPVELRLDLDATGTVRAVVRATPGTPLASLRDAASELRRSLGGGEVRLEPRDEELDLRV